MRLLLAVQQFHKTGKKQINKKFTNCSTKFEAETTEKNKLLNPRFISSFEKHKTEKKNLRCHGNGIVFPSLEEHSYLGNSFFFGFFFPPNLISKKKNFFPFLAFQIRDLSLFLFTVWRSFSKGF